MKLLSAFHPLLGISSSAEGGEKEASIAVDGAKVPAANAAMVNAVMALSYDLSDTFLATALHPSCCVIGAALAVGEREKASGKGLITAVVAGYEITARIGLALNKPPQRSISGRDFEANGLIPSFGAAVRRWQAPQAKQGPNDKCHRSLQLFHGWRSDRISRGWELDLSLECRENSL